MIKTIDISGKWELFFSKEPQSALPNSYSGDIILPDTLSHAGKAPVCEGKADGYLTDIHPFSGYAFFRRNITVCEDTAGCRAFLTLERTRISTLYIDGNKIGTCDSLCGTHSYDIS
ncbi:MAG: beta-galactosidase, partial [Ruminiclostridium sp.]